jgi:hypothetical protein
MDREHRDHRSDEPAVVFVFAYGIASGEALSKGQRLALLLKMMNIGRKIKTFL